MEGSVQADDMWHIWERTPRGIQGTESSRHMERGELRNTVEFKAHIVVDDDGFPQTVPTVHEAMPGADDARRLAQKLLDRVRRLGAWRFGQMASSQLTVVVGENPQAKAGRTGIDDQNGRVVHGCHPRTVDIDTW